MCLIESDVAVVGGGPAGTAAVLALLSRGLQRVVLIERTSYEQRRPGETVSSSLKPLLDYLGVEKIFGETGIRAVGRAASWGGSSTVARDALFDAMGAGWHLDRRCFDARLANLAQQRGGNVLLNTTALGWNRTSHGWAIPIKGRVNGRVHARHLVLATGANSTWEHSRKIIDRLIGVVTWSDTPSLQNFLIESTADGWWYSSPCSAGQVLAFMTDADLIKREDLSPADHARRLASAPAMASRLMTVKNWTPPRAFPARSHIAARCSGPGWVGAGDAVVAFDPLSSLGIGHAIASGIHAARITGDRLEGSSQRDATYEADLRRTFRRYLAEREAVYSSEQRWNDKPFWSRRQNARQAVMETQPPSCKEHKNAAGSR